MHALYFLFSFKSGDRVAIFTCLPLIHRVIPPNVLGIQSVQPVVFYSSSNCFKDFYTFSAVLLIYIGLAQPGLVVYPP